MRKYLIAIMVLVILSSVSVRAEEQKKTIDFKKYVNIDVKYSTDHIGYEASLQYEWKDVDRVGACYRDLDGYHWYNTGAYSSSGGSVHMTGGGTAYYDGDSIPISYSPAFNNKTYEISGVQYLDSGFIPEYKTNDATVAISGCPIFKTEEALDKYLREGIYNDTDLISPSGVDENGNPVRNEIYDKNIPCPQDMRVSIDTSNTNQNPNTNLGNIYIAWDNLDNYDFDNVFIEIQGKFNEFGYYKNMIDRTLRKRTTFKDDSADWIYSINNNSKYITTQGKYTWYGLQTLGKNVDDELGVVNQNYLYDYFTSRCGLQFYSSDFYVVDGSIRIRNVKVVDGKLHVSSWVTKQDLDGSNGRHNIEDETSNPTIVTDDEGNPSDQEYHQDSDSFSSSSSSVSDSESMFDWIANQINGLNRFFASVKRAFSSATNTGTSFVAMFKAYNSWLPESFFTMLVTGIGIVILLRILGR